MPTPGTHENFAAMRGADEHRNPGPKARFLVRSKEGKNKKSLGGGKLWVTGRGEDSIFS